MTATPTDLLSELKRQELYLSELPDNYDFPLFSGRQAVESQRKSGYKNTARAAREIVDNAYESGAKNVRIIFGHPRESSRGKHQRRDAVTAIAFIDDGPGMLPKMVRFALTWGGGTHFKDPNRIGKFEADKGPGTFSGRICRSRLPAASKPGQQMFLGERVSSSSARSGPRSRAFGRVHRPPCSSRSSRSRRSSAASSSSDGR